MCALERAGSLPGLRATVWSTVAHSSVPGRQCRQSYDTEMTGVQEGGHRAQLNLGTKRCSLLMTQWDLPVRAWSMPAAVSADAQLTATL